MILVVDASAAIKWYVTEDGHDQARAILTGRDEITAPEFVAVDLANVFWKKVRLGEMNAEMIQEVLAGLDRRFGGLIAQRDILPRAAELALEIDHPICDCLYLACAELANGGLVTADRRLIEKVFETSWHGRVLALDEIRPLGPSGLKISQDKIEEILPVADQLEAVLGNIARRRIEASPIGYVHFPDDEISSGRASVPYEKPRKYVGSLSRIERIELFALGLLGFFTDGWAWPDALEYAERKALSSPLPERGLVVNLISLSKGYQRYLAEQATSP